MPANGRARDVVAAVAIGLLTAVIYLPAIRLAFAADDFLILDHLTRFEGLRNPAAYFEVNFYAYFRPLVFLSFALDSTIWGVDAAGFHLTNVLLHGINTALVYALARRVGDSMVAGVAALFFALHPVNQEAAFWVSGRFDLLATMWILAALVCLWAPESPGVRTRPPFVYWLGVACFAMALLSKESAAAVVILAAAYGVLVDRRDWRWAIGRLVPLLVVSVAYVVVRNLVGLEAVGGSQRMGKVLMLLAGVGVVLWLSRPYVPAPSRGVRPLWKGVFAGAAAMLILALLMFVPQFRDRIGPSLGFATYAMYSLSPMSLAPVSPAFLDPNRLAWAIGGVAGAAFAIGVVVAAWPWLRARPALLLAGLIADAALVPVSAMPGHTHLYLPSVGVALLAALGVQRIPKSAWRSAVVFAVLVASGAHLAAATARWQRMSAMTRNAVTLVTSHPTPCADREIVLLAAPSGVDGIPSNLNYETFRFLGNCVPRALHTLLRVTREDADIEVTRPARDVIELRVRDYRGNIVASGDLRNYRVQVRDDRSDVTIETPIGRLEARREGRTQLFRLTLTPDAARASFYFYSERQLHALGD